MIMQIREEVDRARAPGPWIAAARALAADSVISDDAASYLIDNFLECITLSSMENDPEMVRLGHEMDRVRREHGLTEDEDWLVHEGPEEWEQLNADWERRDLEIRVATLRALGHGDIAGMMERDPEEFQLRVSTGHGEFWGERLEEDRGIRPELN
jgi:nucleotide-binding universal stress UspA family protein